MMAATDSVLKYTFLMMIYGYFTPTFGRPTLKHASLLRDGELATLKQYWGKRLEVPPSQFHSSNQGQKYHVPAYVKSLYMAYGMVDKMSEGHSPAAVPQNDHIISTRTAYAYSKCHLFLSDQVTHWIVKHLYEHLCNFNYSLFG